MDILLPVGLEPTYLLIMIQICSLWHRSLEERNVDLSPTGSKMFFVYFPSILKYCNRRCELCHPNLGNEFVDALTLCTTDAHYILQSDNGREFVASVIGELRTLWPDGKILNGRPVIQNHRGAEKDATRTWRTWYEHGWGTITQRIGYVVVDLCSGRRIPRGIGLLVGRHTQYCLVVNLNLD